MLTRLARQLHFLRSFPSFVESPVRTLARLALWRLRTLSAAPVTITLEPGLRMRLPADWRGIAKMIYIARDRYEADLVWACRQLRPGMIAVDGGAALGIWTLMMARRVGPSGRIVAIEPSAQLFALLEENVRLNNLTNVSLYRMALGDRAGTANLFHTDGTRGAFSLAAGDGSEAAEPVEITTLDAVFAEQNLPRADLLKLDLEGAEGLALRAAATLLAHEPPPIIVYEQHSGAQAELSHDPAEAFKTLAARGYTQCVIDAATARLTPLAAPIRGGNIICLPSST